MRLAAFTGQARRLLPGLLASAVVAAAAGFLAEHYGAPVMLFALMVGETAFLAALVWLMLHFGAAAG